MSRLQNLLDEIKELEDRVAKEINHEAEQLGYRVKRGRVYFENEIARRHKEMAKSLRQYLAESRWTVILTAPIVYSMLPPLILLDIFISLYQWICFPIYSIPEVRRAEYIILDRHRLKYLNVIEKMHCAYCSYANGFIAYAQEIAARTEQYWCPIKHAESAKTTHSCYYHFLSYGDAEGYTSKLKELRKKYDDLE